MPEVMPALLSEIPRPPVMLSDEAAEEWERVAPEAFNLGLLTIVDVQAFAAYCQAYGRWVVAERTIAKMAALDSVTHGLMVKGSTGVPVANPIIWTAMAAARDMVKYATEFGFTPSSRARIPASQTGKAESKFAGLLG